MPKLPKTPRGMYNYINKNYFDGELPPNVDFEWVEDFGETNSLDARGEMGAVTKMGSRWVMALNRVLAPVPRALFMVIGHECVHLRYPDCNHKDAVWNREVRRLIGKGFFQRVF